MEYIADKKLVLKLSKAQQGCKKRDIEIKKLKNEINVYQQQIITHVSEKDELKRELEFQKNNHCKNNKGKQRIKRLQI